MVLRQRPGAMHEDDNVVKSEHAGPISTIIIDRPKSLNALNSQVLEELESALAALPTEARVLIITGAGEKAFVAGADIKAMADLTAAESDAFSRLGHRVFSKLEEHPIPVIAAVNGFALGGGCEITLACDFAIAADRAKFGLPEVGLGLIPGFGGTTRLRRRVGDARARQMIYTAMRIDAQEALRSGLVNEVVPADELMPRAREIAEQIVKNAPLAVTAAKRSVHLAANTDLTTANAFEVASFAVCFGTQDVREGLKSFIEKRTPEWKGI